MGCILVQKKGIINRIYDSFAEIYRKLIIKPALNYYIKKIFKAGTKILHAGCGSGQVDIEIGKYINIYAMDFSHKALKLYKTNNKHFSQLIYGDINKIPLKNNFFDGIYNLGVLEHLSIKEINIILKEFYRVLKPEGKLLIFWPPKHGISVIALNIIHYFLHHISRIDLQLHPPEISLLKSKPEAKKIFMKTGFKVESIYQGIRDLFTFFIIIAIKPKYK